MRLTTRRSRADIVDCIRYTPNKMIHHVNIPEADTAAAPPSISLLWDILIPAGIVLIPTGIFTLLRTLTAGLDQPHAVPTLAVIVGMVLLEVAGIIAMALLILSRYDAASTQLHRATAGRPPWWRRLSLNCAMFCLLLADLLANVSAAFSGADFLLPAAAPLFTMYLLLRWLALRGRHPGHV